MLYLSNFARPQGAKDKDPRKKRGTLGNLAIGTGVGTLGGLGAGSLIAKKSYNDAIGDTGVKMGLGKDKKEVWKIMKQKMLEDPTGEGRKLMKKGVRDTFRGIAPYTIAAGAGIGLAGTGAYLGGRAILKRLKKKNESNRKG